MSRFGEVADQYDPSDLESAVFEYWDDVDAYERTKAHRSDGEPYFFVDGPPYTNGSAHMGHAWNKSLKDCYIRYRRMCGYDVTDRPGWDMHGLPIETRVEEELGFTNKKDIEDFGEENFIEACKEYAEEQLDGLEASFVDFGVWMDWENPYKTLTPTYMEAAWWGFAKAHERGLVEQGHRSIAQCPRCETAIAKNEVEYEDVSDPSVYVTFDLRDREGALVVWTTTPWTIPANTFTAVDPEAEYVGVRVGADGSDGAAGSGSDSTGFGGQLLYVGAPKAEAVMAEAGIDEYEVVETVTGEEMLGWEYEHPLADLVPANPDHDGAHQVYAAEYVDVEGDGTGLVHSAPGHGEEDFQRGLELGFPIFCPVGGDGVFTDEGGAYESQFVKDADADITADLDERGHLLAAGEIQHSYGHCWRCDTGIVQIVTDQWFITVTDVKDDLLANIEDSEWYPSWARDNRFRDFVEDAPDWNVSRQRYWGIPIPIWLPVETVDGEPVEWGGNVDEAIVVADRDTLAERVDQDVDPETVDLHKDTVDDLTITEDGVVYERVPDVFDVWLDSSVASWGTLDFPEDGRRFDELWPADLIIEAHDQTRGWFWSQLGMGTAALNEIPYRDVLMYGFALMPDGRAMSKSKGLIVDPHDGIDKHGRDALRLSLLAYNPQGEDMRVSWESMERFENTLRTLWNVFRFPLPYMALDGVEPAETDLDAVEEDLEVVDEWLLSRLQTTTADVTDAFDAYRQDRAIEALVDFLVEDLSRFYVQVVRERMWREEDDPAKTAAYATLAHALERVVVLLAPFAPFVTEEIYRTLTGEDGHPTVHMEDWPEVDDRWVDEELETDVAVLRAVEEAGANARQAAGRKLRWPVPRVVVAGDDHVAEAVGRQQALLADRLNAREVEVVDPEERWGELRYSAEADLSVLGPAFQERAGEVMEALNAARVEEPELSALEAAVESQLGEPVELEPEMVTVVSTTPDDVAGSPITVDGEECGVVYVDATLTTDIESEGFAREVIRRVQEMRKELDLDVEERIALEITIEDERVSDLVDEREDLIAEEVRADEIRTVEDGHRQEWDVEDVTVELAISPLEASAPR